MQAKARFQLGMNSVRAFVAATLVLSAFMVQAKGHQHQSGYVHPTHSVPVERIFWEKKPIKLSLAVGHERVIHLPGPGVVKAGVPAFLNRGALRTQVIDNTIYWLANEPFEETRIQVVNTANGETFLFDVEGEEKGGSIAPVEVVKAKPAQAHGAQTAKNGVKTTRPVDYVTLTRYASQQLYAPERLLNKLPGVVRVPLDSETKVKLVRGGKVEALPLISWKGGDFYITAVRLRNKTTDYINLDPRDLRGQWLAATFQHARLFPEGDEADTTAVYVISKRKFDKAL